MNPHSPSLRLVAGLLSAVLAASPAAAHGPGHAASAQLEATQDNPDGSYDNSANRNDGVVAANTSGRGNLTSTLKLSQVERRQNKEVPNVAEDRAKTEPGKGEGFFDKKAVWMGGTGLMFGLFGFLAGGPIGALVGLALGAAAGWWGHGKFGKKKE